MSGGLPLRPLRRAADRAPEAEERPAAPPEPEILDTEFLYQATLGDQNLMRAVLGLFREQALKACAEIAGADIPARIAAAHRLRGSSLGVGAFALAASTRAIELAAGADPALNLKLAPVLEATLRSIDALD